MVLYKMYLVLKRIWVVLPKLLKEGDAIQPHLTTQLSWNYKFERSITVRLYLIETLLFSMVCDPYEAEVLGKKRPLESSCRSSDCKISKSFDSHARFFTLFSNTTL